MAGLGRRIFAAGEVLTAGNVMQYLQDQAVMNFGGSAARGSAIGTAVSEGMVSYLQDTNSVEVYDGSSWKQVYPAVDVPTTGQIVQVVSASYGTSATSTATSYTTIGLSASITPRSTSSKIYVSTSLALSFVGADTGRRAHISLFRGETNISAGASAGSRSLGFGASPNIGNVSQLHNIAPNFLDSPNTTSSTTYSVRFRCESGDALFINRANADVDSALYPRGVCTMTLFEVIG
jgi:hypothetical protein